MEKCKKSETSCSNECLRFFPLYVQGPIGPRGDTGPAGEPGPPVSPPRYNRVRALGPNRGVTRPSLPFSGPAGIGDVSPPAAGVPEKDLQHGGRRRL